MDPELLQFSLNLSVSDACHGSVGGWKLPGATLGVSAVLRRFLLNIRTCDHDWMASCCTSQSGVAAAQCWRWLSLSSRFATRLGYDLQKRWVSRLASEFRLGFGSQ